MILSLVYFTSKNAAVRAFAAEWIPLDLFLEVVIIAAANWLAFTR